ncbi:MAG TPA: tyrosine-type recombinase/integrase [Agitococcus sp.]|nr:tyrosine-type recombinase/integrase [Agitococcus sp.]HNA20980.1 tyrosine-type recombinase/integrase [Agitococcus sp.]HNN27774.1 tyrosine-type recombinase/integrase [Agitococcus sp.]
MKLNARQIELAKPQDKTYSLNDGGGLSLVVTHQGYKSWLFRYTRPSGGRNSISLGIYHKENNGLADARRQRDALHKQLIAGVDPSEARKNSRIEAQQAKDLILKESFEAIAREWHTFKKPHWSESYAQDVIEKFEKDIFPYVQHKHIASIKPKEWLEILKKIEARGALELLRKTRQRCQEVYSYATATGRTEYNAIADLKSALQIHKSVNYPFLVANELPEFLRALAVYDGSFLTKTATQLLMLTGVRTAELRLSTWDEFNLDRALWLIPLERMKKRRLHLVPLSNQSVMLLRELYKVTGYGKLLFPNRNNSNESMSDAAINKVIALLGYKGRLTGHGFRHTMSTILHDNNFNSAWIELQLAHVDKNSVRGTYNHAQYIEQRREMLQWYADYLDSLIDDANT